MNSSNNLNSIEHKRWLGYCAAAASVLIGVIWQLATRRGVSTTLAPLDLALLRYAVPAVLLAPLWGRALRDWRALPWRSLALMLLGAGLPFGLIVMTGAQYAPVAHMGALLPGAMPVFVALACAFWFKERIAPSRAVGLSLIVLGLLFVTGSTLLSGQLAQLPGDGLFLLAALLWSLYTVAYRGSGLAPWPSAALISLGSALCVVPLWLVAPSTRLPQAPLADVLLQGLCQGVIAGVAGLGTYAMSVRYLGATPTAVSGALVPIVTAAGGVVLLGEAMTPAIGVGVCLTVAGVALANGALKLFAKAKLS